VAWRPGNIPSEARSVRCRVIDFDVRERFWALDAVLDQLMAGTDLFRAEIAGLH
jgi:4-hydroxy-tetrahydrodipicolinate synthase